MMETQRRVYVDGRLQTLVRATPPNAVKAKPVKTVPVAHQKRPFPLFDYLINERGFKNDAAIAKAIKTTASYAGRLRNGHVPIGPKIILAVYDGTGMSIEEIRAAIGEEQ